MEAKLYVFYHGNAPSHNLFSISKSQRVADLREILQKASVPIPAKANKADLIAKILASPAAIQALNNTSSSAAPTAAAKPKATESSQGGQDDDLVSVTRIFFFWWHTWYILFAACPS